LGASEGGFGGKEPSTEKRALTMKKVLTSLTSVSRFGFPYSSTKAQVSESMPNLLCESHYPILAVLRGRSGGAIFWKADGGFEDASEGTALRSLVMW
jgi:hypothetical protein